MLIFMLITTVFLLFSNGSSLQPAVVGGRGRRRRHRASTRCTTQQDSYSSQISPSSSSADHDSAASAPVYITVGPPCSGKTEALRARLLSEGHNPDDVFSRDVALDEQSSVYHRVPLAAFLFPSTHLDPLIAHQLLKSGSTVKDRLFDPSYDRTDQELRSVVLRIAGRIPAVEFADRALALAATAGDTVPFFQRRRAAVARDLAAAVEQVAVQAVSEVICQMQLRQRRRDDEDEDDGGGEHSSDELPYGEEEEAENKLDLSTLNATQAHLLSARALIKTPHVELFVPQAIFHGGIDRAHGAFCKLLRSSPRQTPVSWGNTNTRPMEYAAALAAAEETGRPVQFVAWGTGRLPAVGRPELLRRNVARFRHTGRYIPAGAIGAALGRVESLMNDARQQQVDKSACGPGGEEGSGPPAGVHPEEWENHKMDVALAALAGFRMDRDGFVVQEEATKNARQPVRGNKKKRHLSASSGRRQKR